MQGSKIAHESLIEQVPRGARNCNMWCWWANSIPRRRPLTSRRSPPLRSRVIQNTRQLLIGRLIACFSNRLPYQENAGLKQLTRFIGTTVSIVRNCGRNSTDIERTAKYREGRYVGISVERKHLLTVRNRLREWLINRPHNGIRPTQGELLQDVPLKGRSRDGGGRDNGQCNMNPLTVEKEKQLVVHNRAAHTAPEVVHRRSRFVVSRRGIREIV